MVQLIHCHRAVGMRPLYRPSLLALSANKSTTHRPAENAASLAWHQLPSTTARRRGDHGLQQRHDPDAFPDRWSPLSDLLSTTHKTMWCKPWANRPSACPRYPSGRAQWPIGIVLILLPAVYASCSQRPRFQEMGVCKSLILSTQRSNSGSHRLQAAVGGFQAGVR
jgi:hypothetical protein